MGCKYQHTKSITIIMDETIAKREARRKRILENSEHRLQKITGMNNQNEFESKNSNVIFNYR